MPPAIPILFGAVFTVVVCLALGKLALRSLPLKLYRQEEHAFAFVTGAAVLSLLMFLLCAVHAVRPGILLAVGLGIVAAAIGRGAHKPSGKPLPPVPVLWMWVFRSVFALFSILYFVNAMAPEMSPDGMTYHLGVVSQYMRARGFLRITTNMYANLSEGVEMLYLFAYAFGRHSAAALTHFAFLVTLPLAMLCYARRFGFPAAGVCGALLLFASPVVGLDGSVAYNDVATACILFTVFYLVQIWLAEEGSRALLAPIGLIAGFGYAVKYTAFLAVPYALAMIGWRSVGTGKPVVKPLLTIAACAAVMIAPWMIKNAVWLDNPVSPFLNQVFPNPYIHVSFEKDYARLMRHYEGLRSQRDIPLEVTVRGGALGGLLGPVFLLAPIALLALRSSAGRHLLAAGLLFGLPYAANVGTRFLIPALPFVALAMGLVAARWMVTALALIAVHAVLSWPSMVNRYCSPAAWRLEQKRPIRQALRIESEASYLNFKSGAYGTAVMIDKLVPAGEKVLSFGGGAQSYTSREIVVGYQSAFGALMQDILWTPMTAGAAPTWRLRFRYPAQRLRQIRVTQTASGEPDQWSVSELRIYQAGSELARGAGWKLRARPNPWDVQLAFDNSPVTRWKSWDTLHPGMFLSVEFPAPELSDSVVLECPHDQYKIRLKLEGMDEAGNWKQLAGEPEASEAIAPAGLRRLAIEEVKARGLHYLLVGESDYGAQDFQHRQVRWGMTLLGEHDHTRLYRLD